MSTTGGVGIKKVIRNGDSDRFQFLAMTILDMIMKVTCWVWAEKKNHCRRKNRGIERPRKGDNNVHGCLAWIIIGLNRRIFSAKVKNHNVVITVVHRIIPQTLCKTGNKDIQRELGRNTLLRYFNTHSA